MRKIVLGIGALIIAATLAEYGFASRSGGGSPGDGSQSPDELLLAASFFTIALAAVVDK